MRRAVPLRCLLHVFS